MYKGKGWKIYKGDCLKIIPKLIKKNIKVDAIIADPPYGTTSCKWDAIIPFDKMWKYLDKIIKENGVIVLFGSEPFSSALRMSNIKNFRYDWIWHKSSSGGFVTAKFMPMKFHENISVFYKKQPIYNPQFQEYSRTVKEKFKNGQKVNTKNCKKTNNIQNGINSNIKRKSILFNKGKYPESVQFFKSVPNCNGKRLHPTQKPVALMEYLIKTYTNKGDTVLDFTMGSGTTGIATISLGRKFIGIELNKEYYKIAKRRLKECQTSQLN